MVLSSPIVDPINSIPSSVTNVRTNKFSNFIPPYRTIVYSTPIPSMRNGIPQGLLSETYFNKYNAPKRSVLR
jgi:hypothetical protein